MASENREMRQEILKLLYNEAVNNDGYGILTFIALGKKLASNGLSIEFLKFNLRWLRARGYINYPKLIGLDFSIGITDVGIDHVEEEKDFQKMDPTKANQPQQLPAQNITYNGPIYGTVNTTTGQASPIYNNKQITEAFNKVYSMIRDDTRFATESQVAEKLKELQLELDKKHNANKGKLEGTLEWLKEHTYEIATIIEPIVPKAIGA